MSDSAEYLRWCARLKMRRDRLVKLQDLDAPQFLIDKEHELIRQAEIKVELTRPEPS